MRVLIFPMIQGMVFLALLGLFTMAATDVDDNQARQDVAGADMHKGVRSNSGPRNRTTFLSHGDRHGFLLAVMEIIYHQPMSYNNRTC